MISKVIKRLKRAFSNNRRPRLRRKLTILQNDDLITLTGDLSNSNYYVKELWLKLRDSEETIRFANEATKNYFNFNINLTDNKKLLYDQSIYDLFLLVSLSKDTLSDKRIERLQNNPQVNIVYSKNKQYFEYPIRLGRFAETDSVGLETMEIDGRKCEVYKTVKGNLSLAIDREITQKIISQIDYLKSKRNELVFGGKLFTRTHQVKELKIILLGRETKLETKVRVPFQHMEIETKRRFGLNRYLYEVKINLNDLVQDWPLKDDIYDLYFDLQFHGVDEIRRLRIGRPRLRARINLKAAIGRNDNKVYTVSPYYTFRQLNLSLHATEFNKDTYKYLRKMMRWSFLFRPFTKRQDVWLIGELPYKAQDTGYHLFKYIRKNYPNDKVYYVIREDSPEVKNVSSLGNVVYYKSKEHIKATIMATRIIGSHHPDYLYPLRMDEFKRKVKAKKVFLQHGVMGTKNMVANYGKNSFGFETDLFLVSSQLEKEMIVNDFEYNKNEVVVTGLSRFDSLFKNDIEVKRQLLIIPTWREWLVRDDIFLTSKYFENYLNLINSPTLHEIAEKYQFEIVFCLHPNMQRYTSYFKDAPVRIIKQGDVDVQRLLKESAIMITDYSSVAFDFSFLNKPIIYYQFDRDRFLGKRGSHLDLPNDLPGDIVNNENEVIATLKDYAKNNFQMKEENQDKASRFLMYKDLNSSERIYQAIKNKVRKKNVIEIIIESKYYQALFRRFRRSKRYFPTMKLFYNIARRLLPVDEKLILFESGIGKQYADSPRYIYEEITKRNLDYKKVWICNNLIRFQDPDTIRVNRFSPSYFYYLARAKYWINNQNFPTYIEKRPETTYIQTWHGTPLKRMLHDLETVMGRRNDYVDRVSNAIKNWDHLVSPSPYATNAFKSAFKFDKDIIETGYPRNDIFYYENGSPLAQKVRRRLSIPEDKKVVLYAPTFRDDQATKKNRFSFDINMDLNKMKEELGDNYIILLRMHVVVRNRIKIDESLEGFVQDVSNYMDMQELLLITDILITDYSSVMFDFANTGRPMLFYTYDLENYRDDIRGFYMDFEEEAPGPLLRNTDELIDALLNVKDVYKRYNEKYQRFYNKYCSLEDGRASERIVDNFFK